MRSVHHQLASQAIYADKRSSILDKTDLPPHVDSNESLAVVNAHQLNPDIAVLQVSARSGDGLAA
jgi:hydrogenase nickel incorporation protein HypB